MAELYARHGHELRDPKDVDYEIVAEYVEKNLLTDERTIRRMVRQNSSLGQYILDWLNSLLARLGNASAQEREFLYKARGLYANALEESHYPHKKPDKREVQAKLENLREAYNTGEITEEEFDAYRDEIDGDESLAEADMLGPFSINGNYKDASGNQYSISEIVGEKGSYGQGVVLNTNLFDGVNPRNWGKVLGKFVYENLAGKELTMYDENENAETVYLAREKDRIKKDGAKNSHKVIDKLAGHRGDRTRAKAIVHLDEALQVSIYKKSTDEHSHQWMDEKGWELRTVYLQDGREIYEATLNIAYGRYRKTLYDISRVHQIDIAKNTGEHTITGESQRSSYPEPKMGRTQSSVSPGIVTQGKPYVKSREEALSETGVPAADIIFRETGWYSGADGKWRFEIDDSGMRYQPREGNAEERRTRMPNTGSEDTMFAEGAMDDWLDTERYAGYNEQTDNAEGGVNYGREMGDDLYRGREQALPGEQSAEGSGQYRRGEAVLPGEGRAAGDRGQNLLRKDSEGRRLSEEEAEELAGTAIVDDEGHPLAVYHFTPEMDFETFERGDIGFHFGTQQQAEQRGKDLKAATGRMFRTYLNIRNPYRMRLDINCWQPPNIGLYLWAEGVITDAEWNEVQELGGRGYDAPSAQRLREILAERG